MPPHLHELLDKAKSGQPEAFARLVDALRTLADGDASILLEAARSPDPLLRRASAQIAPSRHPAAAVASRLLMRIPPAINPNVSAANSNDQTGVAEYG